MSNMKKIWIFGLGLIVSILLFSSFSLGGRGGSLHGSSADVPAGIDIGDGEYRDGTYTGTARGYQDGLTVELTIEGGMLVALEIVDHSEVNPQFWQRPMNLLPQVVINEQSTDIDAVGGATATSHGILSAVENALEQARI